MLDSIHFEQLLARVDNLLDDLDVFLVHVFTFGVDFPVVVVRLLDPVYEFYEGHDLGFVDVAHHSALSILDLSR